METRCVLVWFLLASPFLEVQGQDKWHTIDLRNHTCGMSSVYWMAATRTNSDCHAAINGNTSGFMLITPELQNCIHGSESSDFTTPTWWVDMGHVYTVSLIRIYARDGHADRLNFLHVLIDQYLVYTTGNSTPRTAGEDGGIYVDIFNVPNLPHTGRNLTIYRNHTVFEDWDNVLNFCEVQVRECADGYYGATCESCGHCSGAPCNKLNGSCGSCQPGWSIPLCTSCSPGYFGPDCTPCGEGCQNGVCQQDGVCSCSPGWTIQYCNIPCQHGYYGQDCKLQCSAGCNQNGTCDNVNGTCVCQPGWRGDKCTECAAGHYGASCEACGAGCQSGTCQENGQCVCTPGWLPENCTTPCQLGRYGQDCKLQCSAGCDQNGKCDNVNGTCVCQPGWRGDKCTECSSGNYGIYAEVSASPTVCVPCGQGCDGHACDVTSGKCTCLAGWQPPRCDSKCPPGKYGVDCGKKCGPGCQGGTCDDQTGICTCMEHWKQPLCDECAIGFYGPSDNCRKKCSQGCVDSTPCKSTDGSCTCRQRWIGDTCDVESAGIDSANVGGVAGGVLGAVVVVAVGVVVGVILFRSRRACVGSGNGVTKDMKILTVQAPDSKAQRVRRAGSQVSTDGRSVTENANYKPASNGIGNGHEAWPHAHLQQDHSTEQLDCHTDSRGANFHENPYARLTFPYCNDAEEAL